jgi:hypothetical protein
LANKRLLTSTASSRAKASKRIYWNAQRKRWLSIVLSWCILLVG